MRSVGVGSGQARRGPHACASFSSMSRCSPELSSGPRSKRTGRRAAPVVSRLQLRSFKNHSLVFVKGSLKTFNICSEALATVELIHFSQPHTHPSICPLNSPSRHLIAHHPSTLPSLQFFLNKSLKRRARCNLFKTVYG